MIALYKGVSFTSTVIRAFTWSDYTHASWTNDDDLSEIEAWTKGVVEVPYFGTNHTPGTSVDFFRPFLSVGEEQGLVEFLRKQIGKRYDFAGALGFATRNDKAQDQDAWFCTELIFAGFVHIRQPLLARIPAHKVYPGLLSYSPKLIHAMTLQVKERAQDEAITFVERMRSVGSL